MKSFCIANLNEIKLFINQLSSKDYQKEVTHLSGSSIGGHIRHILEFYICLIDGFSKREINYDARKRDLKIECDIDFATQKINWITTELIKMEDCIPLTLKANFETNQNKQQVIITSLSRELAYCMEHSIHHQALIKVATIELEISDLIQKSFGVAPSTLKYQNGLN